MTRRLKRSTLAAISDWWSGSKGGGREQTQEAPAPAPNMVFIGVNTSNALITPGNLVAVVGFRPLDIAYPRAKKLCLANKLKLSVKHYSTFSSDTAGVGVALTAAVQNHILYFRDAAQTSYFADVNGATGDYVTKEGNATTDKEEAVAEILFSTPAFNGRRVAFCKRIEKSLTAAEATNNTMAYLDAQKKVNATVVTNASFAVNSNGFLEIVNTTKRITYYGVKQS